MGIRETINRHKNITVGVACLLIVGAFALIVLQSFGGGASASGGAGSRLFFSTDDGKTWFLDDSKNIPPFTKDGKEAVRAHVYRTSDGTEFVGSLERYTPAGKKLLEASLLRPPHEQAVDDPYMAVDGSRQVKKPGDATWVSVNDPRAEAVQDPVSPKGKGNAVTSVAPPQ